MNKPRPGMPSLQKIVDHWAIVGESIFPDIKASWIGWGEPFCFRCGWHPPLPNVYQDVDSWNSVSGWLERAHLHDKVFGGPDTPENIVPLCPLCHYWMPDHKDGSEPAIAWVREKQPKSCQHWWQMATDRMWSGEKFAPYPGWKVFFDLYLRMSERRIKQLERDLEESA